MFTRSTLALLALSIPLAAQEPPVTTEEVASEVVTPNAQKADASAFYQAYFLDREEVRSKEATAKAIALYEAFLAAQPEHALAARAASRCAILVYGTGDLDKARAFVKKHKDLIAKQEEADAAARRERVQADQELLTKLRGAAAAAREAGDNVEFRRINAAMRRVSGGRPGMGRRGQPGGAGRGPGGFGAGRRQMGAGAQIPKIVDMEPAKAKEVVEQFVTRMERMIDFIANGGNEDQADKLEAKLDKVQDLVDEGKLKEAQAILDTLQADLQGAMRGGRGNARRRGQGGGQGGRPGARREETPPPADGPRKGDAPPPGDGPPPERRR